MTDRPASCGLPQRAHRPQAAWRLPATLAAALLALAAGAAAEPERYAIDPAHTFAHFAVSHLGFSLHRGRFNRSEGFVKLDPAAGRGRVELVIDAASVDTGDAELEKQLRGPNFLDVATHPTLRFVGERFAFAEGRPVAVDGTLTLLGATRPITLAIDHFHCATHPLLRRWICGANATATLRRSEFGMGKFLSMVGDEVTISVQVEAVRDSAAADTERLERSGRDGR